MVAAAGDRGGGRALLLVDWELAGARAPRVRRRHGAGRVPARVGRVDPDRSTPATRAGSSARAGHPLRRMRPAIHAFWSAYRAARTQTARRCDRVVELAAVRLLQTAVERAQCSPARRRTSSILVQLADNMLRSPEDAAHGLLGLRG